MKNFIITSKIQSIKTLQYNVEAESLEEAIQLVAEGEYRGEGEEIDDTIQWETETELDGWEDKDDEVVIPAGTKGVWIMKGSTYYTARFGANVEVEFDYTGGDTISVKWLDDLANGQMNGGYFFDNFIFEK
jgi:hypothetical protein